MGKSVAHHDTHRSYITLFISKKMELPHLGTHCSLASCNRLDYLPFKCKHCVKNFCENHWKVGQHDCSNAPVFHSDKASNQGQTKVKSVKKKKAKQNPCQMPNCNGFNLVRMGCGECGLNFCVKHRFPEDHECLRRHTSRLSRLITVK